MTRIYFATDVHGSNKVWRKWINVPYTIENVNVLILAGDLTGKSVIPIIDRGDKWTARFLGKTWELKSREEVEELKNKIGETGYYAVEMTPDEVQEYQNNPKKLEELFAKVMTERMEEWLNMVLEKVPENVEVIVMPGNDDEFCIDPVIQKFEKESGGRIIYPLGKAVELNSLPGYQIISFDYVNPTPWNTPREDNEKGLWKRMEKLVDLVTVDWDHVLLNFHCPPYGTRLDLAPKLDKNLKPVYVLGEQIREHVGSKSVRKFIKKYQPLMGLHGHIHESYAADKIGRTVVVNPGSEYVEGILRGFIIDIDPHKGLERWWKVEG
ncbi:MAG: metallophosphoesterase family protein [Candidatus Njordarchaeales archaeon]